MRQKTEFFFGVTHTGKVRDNNEDAFLVEKILQDKFVLACVIDGVGGYEGGEVAADIARKCILQHLQKPSEDLFIAVREAVIIANEKIYNEKMASDKNNRMACVLTLAIIDLTYNQFYYAHVGDTRLYLLRDHTLVKITRDDSFVGFLEDTKRLSEEEAMNHPKRNEINKALGFDPNIAAISDYIETGISPFLPGDTLLLCSDGLTDMIDSKTIRSVLTSKQKIDQKAKALITAANDAGGKDNITVVLVQNVNEPVIQKATKPPVLKKKELQKENDEQEGSIIPQRGNNTGSRAWIVVLTILCLGLLTALLWQLSNNKKMEPELSVVQKQPNAAEELLQDSILQNSNLVLYDSLYGKSISVTDTIYIEADSVRINGYGMTLRGDADFNGAGLVISPTCKYIRLENLVFENFQTAIAASSTTVEIKNVRFQNCVVSLDQKFKFPDNVNISGNIIDTLLFKTDSLPK
jgi:serine/threonine protein phosphatase PrpC